MVLLLSILSLKTIQPAEERKVCKYSTVCTVLLEGTALEVSHLTFTTKSGLPLVTTRQQENQNYHLQ